MSPYASLIRSHLEYAVPIWSPYLRDDIENVQHPEQPGWPQASKEKTMSIE